MFPLNLPIYNIKITTRSGKKVIYDEIRKRYVALTPEEWVRQHFIHFLINHKGYPSALMGNEILLTLNGLKKRCDTVLYDKQLFPRMIIEYKAPKVPITQKVFTQICHYNIVLRVDYLIISNGLDHYCCKMNYETNSYQFLEEIPDYNFLQQEFY